METEEVVRFHGHMCPGLALGMKVVEIAKRYFERGVDEELVAIVENNSCAVDAIQYFMSCTFGKGNLIFRDYGKHVYTFISRDRGVAIRIALKKNMIEEFREKFRDREEVVNAILESEPAKYFEVREVDVVPPEEAMIFPSVPCSRCGEPTMETRLRVLDGSLLCIPCFEVELKKRRKS